MKHIEWTFSLPIIHSTDNYEVFTALTMQNMCMDQFVLYLEDGGTTNNLMKMGDIEVRQNFCEKKKNYMPLWTYSCY